MADSTRPPTAIKAITAQIAADGGPPLGIGGKGTTRIPRCDIAHEPFVSKQMSKQALSIAIGGDEWRYKAAVIFAATLLRYRLTGPGRSWTLYATLKPSDFSGEYETLLDKAGAKVSMVFRKNNYVYNTERYLVHDLPEVKRWIAMDSHYDLDKDDVETIKKYIKAWKRSHKPIMTHSWGKYAKEKPWSGGWFGIEKKGFERIGYDETMFDLLNEYFEDDLEKRRKDSAYGDDERFLGLLEREISVIEDDTDKSEVYLTKTWYSTARARLEPGKKLDRLYDEAKAYIQEYADAETTEEEDL